MGKIPLQILGAAAGRRHEYSIRSKSPKKHANGAKNAKKTRFCARFLLTNHLYGSQRTSTGLAEFRGENVGLQANNGVYGGGDGGIFGEGLNGPNGRFDEFII
jgi:hypothetical protein